ncbi:hypothetical protein BLX87_02425 [Bacillus sp. VT-16-64]|nr:hypothetical protein BLX87_02425 [Bacillus sp. VT-16-64]
MFFGSPLESSWQMPATFRKLWARATIPNSTFLIKKKNEKEKAVTEKNGFHRLSGQPLCKLYPLQTAWSNGKEDYLRY